MQQLDNIRIYSCLDRNGAGTNCVRVEIDLLNGTAAAGQMTTREARALASILLEAADAVEARTGRNDLQRGV
ncbi:MAG: hypothetical protein RMJ43_09540 [Chloroherpetonaceae bacterium]|nr:hypothetical protein [Chthonomonadaceae bacterium]MDW8208067.1 hypothetical protein [Chloroherpetonaceae bacterium]